MIFADTTKQDSFIVYQGLFRPIWNVKGIPGLGILETSAWEVLRIRLSWKLRASLHRGSPVASWKVEHTQGGLNPCSVLLHYRGWSLQRLGHSWAHIEVVTCPSDTPYMSFPARDWIFRTRGKVTSLVAFFFFLILGLFYLFLRHHIVSCEFVSSCWIRLIILSTAFLGS